ncbi:hypothetical protein Zmor_005986 [Zophobas morio]|uniref:Uncharacterized protein n=1 Tax=Zophobas morio TaxID=2755281 RepID=A0AA38ML13_9CUCU|nr:hypothetical protein Zmor_005986 [Zophobas morio]
MGVFGDLRKIEIVQLTIEKAIDKGSIVLVQIPKTKTDESKSFTIIEEEEMGALQLVRKCACLRSPGLTERRGWEKYDSKCPSIIVRYLKLENPKQYTGHCLQSTPSTFLVEAGGSFETFKRHGKWKSTTVAEGFIADSMATKNKAAQLIASSVFSAK